MKIHVKKNIMNLTLCVLFVCGGIIIFNYNILAQDTITGGTQTVRNANNFFLELIKLLTTTLEGIIGTVIVIGFVIYQIVTKGKLIRDLFIKFFKTKSRLDEPLFYDNHDTIVDYLLSDRIDNYNTAFEYLLVHNEFPHKIILILSDIILGKKPFNKRNWITEQEKIRAGQHLCFVLKKNCQKLNHDNGLYFCNVEDELRNRKNNNK